MTDLALRVTKVSARSLGKAMSTLVAQDRHLWLSLAEMSDVDKVCSRHSRLPDWTVWQHCRGLCPAEQLCGHRDLVLRHLSQLGLQVNWENSRLTPMQRNSFLSTELDSVSVVACLTNERAQSMLICLSSFRGRMVVPLNHFQRLLGNMASAATVSQLGLLQMGPLQHRLHSRVPRWACRHGTFHVTITPTRCRSFSTWTDLVFLRVEVP